MKAVVLAGGEGTRLAPYTRILPKPLLPVGDRPILDIIIGQLRDSGVEEIVLATGYLSGLIEAYRHSGSWVDVGRIHHLESVALALEGSASEVVERAEHDPRLSTPEEDRL